MKIEILIEEIKNKFISHIDAGLLFKIDPDKLNTPFYFDDDKINYGRRENYFTNYNNNKEDIYRYLTKRTLQIRSDLTYGTNEFYRFFWELWLWQFDEIKTTIANVPGYWKMELVKPEDLIIINVHVLRYVKIFIINDKYITEIEIDSKKLRHRTEHLIIKDVKRISADENCVYVYFHGVHNPFSIQLENYGEVIKLQRQLLELRNKPFVKNNKNRR